MKLVLLRQRHGEFFYVRPDGIDVIDGELGAELGQRGYWETVGQERNREDACERGLYARSSSVRVFVEYVERGREECREQGKRW